MATSTYMQFGETYIGQKHILKKIGFEQERHVQIANQIICLKKYLHRPNISKPIKCQKKGEI